MHSTLKNHNTALCELCPLFHTTLSIQCIIFEYYIFRVKMKTILQHKQYVSVKPI